MGYKVFNTEEVKMKKNFDAVVKAFEKFDDRGGRWSVPVPKRFNLGAKFVKGYSCEHDWEALNGADPTTKAFLQKKFDEQELGDQQMCCRKCKAFSLWEQGKLFAYDAIVIEEDVQETPKASRRPGRR